MLSSGHAKPASIPRQIDDLSPDSEVLALVEELTGYLRVGTFDEEWYEREAYERAKRVLDRYRTDPHTTQENQP